MLFLVLVMFLFVGCVEVEEKGEIDEIENDVSVISVENKKFGKKKSFGTIIREVYVFNGDIEKWVLPER